MILRTRFLSQTYTYREKDLTEIRPKAARGTMCFNEKVMAILPISMCVCVLKLKT
jgi:hypothetical protein